MLNKIKSWIYGVLLMLLLFGFILYEAVKSGKNKERVKQQELVIDNVSKAKESRQDSGELSDAERIERMRKRNNH